jgi:hypothetical protein
MVIANLLQAEKPVCDGVSLNPKRHPFQKSDILREGFPYGQYQGRALQGFSHRSEHQEAPNSQYELYNEPKLPGGLDIKPLNSHSNFRLQITPSNTNPIQELLVKMQLNRILLAVATLFATVAAVPGKYTHLATRKWLY